MTTVLMDGDIITYKACLSTEYTVYKIPSEQTTFRYKKEIDEYIHWNYDVEEGEWVASTIVKDRVVEPFNHATHIAEIIIDNVLKNTGVNEYEIYLSGSTNFRNQIPYPQVYKGNRTQPKPFYLEKMRQWLVEYKNATVVEGLECDDMLAIRQTELKGNSIIASIDKDLRQVPGKHYHMDDREITTINELDAFRNFGIQMLMGDRTDNVIGCPGIGIKTAEKILNPLKDRDTIFKAVKDKYQEAFGPKADEMFRSNMGLLMLKVIR